MILLWCSCVTISRKYIYCMVSTLYKHKNQSTNQSLCKRTDSSHTCPPVLCVTRPGEREGSACLTPSVSQFTFITHLSSISHFSVQAGMPSWLIASASLAPPLLHLLDWYLPPASSRSQWGKVTKQRECGEDKEEAREGHSRCRHRRRGMHKRLVTLTALRGWCMKWSLLFFLIGILRMKNEKIISNNKHPIQFCCSW